MKNILFCLVLLTALPAYAGQSEARAVALANSCKPTKIDIARQTFGTEAATTYKITCESKAPQGASGAASTPPTLTVRCQGKLCVAL